MLKNHYLYFFKDHRILLFSQFTMVLDIIQEYMNIKNYKFLRLDGQVPVPERFIFLPKYFNLNVFNLHASDLI